LFGFEWWSLALAVVAGVACGFLNTVASSGSAVSLPVLMAIGLDPITANATNRIPLLLGSISATMSFSKKKALPWALAIKASIPTSIGAIVGARLIELFPRRDVGLIITAAILLALLLLFTKVKEAIAQSEGAPVRFGLREVIFFFGIGVWLGFIVLDGATYLLLVLTLGVGLSLVPATAVKSAVLVSSTLVSMVIFVFHGEINWTMAALTGGGSLLGGVLGARFTMSPNAKRYIFWLLAGTIFAEVIHLGVHYFYKTH
jgi:uncharacterized membrane protein YfcA